MAGVAAEEAAALGGEAGAEEEALSVEPAAEAASQWPRKMLPSSAVKPSDVSMAGQQWCVIVAMALQQSVPISACPLRKNRTTSFEHDFSSTSAFQHSPKPPWPPLPPSPPWLPVLIPTAAMFLALAIALFALIMRHIVVIKRRKAAFLKAMVFSVTVCNICI